MSIIITPTGFKTSAKGRVVNSKDKAAALFGSMSKGEARKLRKSLAAAGLQGYAAVRRAAA